MTGADGSSFSRTLTPRCRRRRQPPGSVVRTRRSSRSPYPVTWTRRTENSDTRPTGSQSYRVSTKLIEDGAPTVTDSDFRHRPVSRVRMDWRRARLRGGRVGAKVSRLRLRHPARLKPDPNSETEAVIRRRRPCGFGRGTSGSDERRQRPVSGGDEWWTVGGLHDTSQFEARLQAEHFERLYGDEITTKIHPF